VAGKDGAVIARFATNAQACAFIRDATEGYLRATKQEGPGQPRKAIGRAMAQCQIPPRPPNYGARWLLRTGSTQRRDFFALSFFFQRGVKRAIFAGGMPV
jgi:hypothetical protein